MIRLTNVHLRLFHHWSVLRHIWTQRKYEFGCTSVVVVVVVVVVDVVVVVVVIFLSVVLFGWYKQTALHKSPQKHTVGPMAHTE